MVNELLVNLVDTVLGQGKKRSRGNKAYICPFHTQDIVSEKLEINFDENSSNYQSWACWACPSSNKSRGKSIQSLFKKKGANPIHFDELKTISPDNFNNNTKTEPTENTKEAIIPKDYKKFEFKKTNIIERRALSYLRKRNITKEDINKYNIGYCEYGSYSDMIIIPSYDSDGQLNFFTGRSFMPEPFSKYKNSDCSKDIIMFDLFINWDVPVILCEGVFDSFALKRNAIPIMGKIIQPELMKKLIISSTKEIYIALDNDALDYALDYCQMFMDEGKKVYLIELEGKDPSELGFERMMVLLQNAVPLDMKRIIELKFSL